MTRFIVFTVDHDEQQAFVDVAQAESREAALETVLEHRDYCCYGAAYAAAELRELAERAVREPADFFENELRRQSFPGCTNSNF